MAGSAYFLVLPKINYPGLASPPMGLSSLTSILIKKLSHRLAEVPLHIDDSSFVFSLCQLFTNQHLSVLSSCSESGDQVWELQSPDAHWVLTSTLGKFNSFSCCSSTKHSAEGQARSQPTVAHFLCSPFPVPSLLSSSFFGLIFLDSTCWHSTQQPSASAPFMCHHTRHSGQSACVMPGHCQHTVLLKIR